jgi:hypothetical protein
MKTLILLLLTQLPAHLLYKHLKFSDFRGHGPNPGLTVSNIDLIENDSDGIASFKVDAYFLPEESYINVRTPAVLQHEQGHLDITEIYTRRMRAFLRRHPSCDKQEKAIVDAYYARLIEDWKAEELQYDEKTDHSRNIEQQAAWLTKIAAELAQ